MEDAGTDGSGRAPNHNVDRSAKSPTEDAAELGKKGFLLSSMPLFDVSNATIPV